MSNLSCGYVPGTDFRTLLAQRGVTISHLERVAGMARGSLSRILTGRRGGDSLFTAEKVAKALGLPLDTVVSAILTSVTDAQERRRRVLDGELARREALVRPWPGSPRRW